VFPYRIAHEALRQMAVVVLDHSGIDAAKSSKETRADFVRRAIASLVEREVRKKLKPKP
jgi:hypothetical protein